MRRGGPELRRRMINFLMDRGFTRLQGKNKDLMKMVADQFGVKLVKGKRLVDQVNNLLKYGKVGIDMPVERSPEKPKKAKSVCPGPAFYDSDQWRLLRYQVLKRYGGRCQCCGRGAADGVTLHVDHIQPRSKRPDLELDMNNLQVLCADCNLGKLAWDTTDWRPLHSQPDSPGNKTGIGRIAPVGQRTVN